MAQTDVPLLFVAVFLFSIDLSKVSDMAVTVICYVMHGSYRSNSFLLLFSL